MKKTTVYLDMDGTIANLYGIENWLPRLRNEDTEIFKECEPMISQSKLLELFPETLYKIVILSMTPKNATQEYCKNVEEQKDIWLDKFFPKLEKRIYKKYSNNKNLKNSSESILIDDNEEIRNNFRGQALDPTTLW